MWFYFAWHWTGYGRFGTVNAVKLHRCWRELMPFRKMDLIWSYSDNRVLRIENLNQNFVELWPVFKHTGAEFAILVRDVNMLPSLQGRRTDCAESWSNDFPLVHLSYIVIVEENGVSIFAGRLAFDCLNHAGVKESIFPRSTDTNAKKRIFWPSSGGQHYFFPCRLPNNSSIFGRKLNIFSRYVGTGKTLVVQNSPIETSVLLLFLREFLGVYTIPGGIYNLSRYLIGQNCP